MSRRRRRVKIKSSSRLFAFILFNLLLLASCITAHYQQQQQQQQQQSQLWPSTTPLHLIEGQRTSRFEQSLSTHQRNFGASGATLSSQQTSQLNAQQTQQVSYDADAVSQESNEANGEQQRPLGILNRDSIGNQSISSIAADLCASLPSSVTRQLKLCRFVGHSPQADRVVTSGTTLGLDQCRHQFRSERWNCTHAAGDHHLLTSKLTQSVGYRESGFMQAILAAGIVHQIATACSEGTLSDCACDKSRVGPMRDQNFKWGGCSNNIRYGMMYARHLVDLLDAVHEHHHHQMQRSLNSNHHHHHHSHRPSRRAHHKLEKRSPNQQHSTATTAITNNNSNFCQKNQNISHSTHVQLIKSLLAKNSLERHQDFRLAMNAHNNKVGRLAVAKSMELKCRCHGLSGSCSLKTCWLKLPDFQKIGALLKLKYEASIHLPTAINVNKLIPMMDKNEISAILQQQQHHHQLVGANSAGATTIGQVASDSAPVEGTNSLSPVQLQLPEAAAWSSETPQSVQNTPIRLNYYERHKQLEQQLASSTRAQTNANSNNNNSNNFQASNGTNRNNHFGPTNTTTTSLFVHGDEVPVQIVPMSQLQYQTLLRDMKLCHANYSISQQLPSATTTSPKGARYLNTRDLGGIQFESGAGVNSPINPIQQRQFSRKSAAATTTTTTMTNGNEIGAGDRNKLQLLAQSKSMASSGAASNQLQQQQQLGQLLQVNNRDELVYLHKSPDYCEPDLRHGFGGVQSRSCSKEPHASDSCDKLCCGRGYERHEIELREHCECKFQYCCKIQCKICLKTVVKFVCK